MTPSEPDVRAAADSLAVLRVRDLRRTGIVLSGSRPGGSAPGSR
jgi:hypothetical protein